MEKPMDAAVEKSVLRELLKKIRDQLDPEQLRAWNQSLHQKFWQLPRYRSAKVVMLYLSFGSEVDTWPLLEQAWIDGKRTVAPKVRRYPKELLAVEITAITDLEPSFWGISEPISDLAVDPGEIDLVVVPGLAFNREGYRLGYGGGYYDRFLPQVKGYKVGLCYPPFLREIPVAPWDQAVDCVLVP